MFSTEEDFHNYSTTKLHKIFHTLISKPKKDNHIVIRKKNEKDETNNKPVKQLETSKNDIYINVDDNDKTKPSVSPVQNSQESIPTNKKSVNAAGNNTESPDNSYVTNRPNAESGIIKPEPARTIELKTPTNSSENKAIEISERDALINEGRSTEHQLTLEDIQNSVDVQTLLNQTHALMEITKNNLKNISIKQLKLTNIADRGKVKHMPIDNALLHTLGSIIVGKNLDLIFIFRDGNVISMCPESWLQVQQPDQLKKNFEWTYSPFDIQKFISELSNLTAAVTNTPEWTQLWMKYVPII